MELTLYTSGLDKLGKLFERLESVKSVTSATRVRSLSAPASNS